jgi:hypothetical protein
MSPTRSNPGPWTEIRLGARAHHTHTSNRAHAPPANNTINHTNPDAALDEAVPAQIRSSDLGQSAGFAESPTAVVGIAEALRGERTWMM